MDMLRNPGFDRPRLEVHKGKIIEALKQRNDDASDILDREFSALLYGRDHFEAAEPTQKSIESITPDDLRGMHKRIFHPAPGSLFIAVTGDFEEKDMLARLEKALQGWAAAEVPANPPAPTATFTPGVYHVEKDIPQGKVSIGLRGITRDDPDYFAMLLMNQILGGGGFTSRITARVRSDEGLAYSAGSSMSPRVWYLGAFNAGFQSKNATVALAIKIILEEIERMRSAQVSETELDTARRSFIETFPRTFESKPTMLSVFVNDEMTNRPARYWQTYRQKIQEVSPGDIQRVALKHLTPENMAIFVVGKWDEIYPGDAQGRASMQEFFNGEVTHVPLRDPLTLEAPE
jgi:predicted Zn-dependent peptidase